MASGRGRRPRTDYGNRLLTGGYNSSLKARGNTSLDYSADVTGNILRFQDGGGRVRRVGLLTGKVTSQVLVDDIQNTGRISPEVGVRADGKGALVWSRLLVDGRPMQRLGLVTFGKPGIEILALLPFGNEGIPSPVDHYVHDFALSPTMVSWVVSTSTLTGEDLATTYELHQRPRAGGTGLHLVDAHRIRRGGRQAHRDD